VNALLTHIHYQPIGQNYEEGRFGDFIRVPFREARLRANHGLDGDQKAGHNARRQVNLVSAEWLEKLGPKGYRTGPGQFGEQLIVSGLDLLSLAAGDRIRIGRDAVLEMTKPRTGCSRLEAAQGRPITCGPIGMLATVIESGDIAVGDPVVLLRAESA
jgi:MOSC domain-containing protein YiiM